MSTALSLSAASGTIASENSVEVIGRPNSTAARNATNRTDAGSRNAPMTRVT